MSYFARIPVKSRLIFSITLMLALGLMGSDKIKKRKAVPMTKTIHFYLNGKETSEAEYKKLLQQQANELLLKH